MDAAWRSGPSAAPAAGDAELGAHLIRRPEVPAFLDGSVWPHTTFHNTTREGHEAPLRGPIDTGPPELARGNEGKGLYVSFGPKNSFGDRFHEVAIRARNPYVFEYEDRFVGLPYVMYRSGLHPTGSRHTPKETRAIHDGLTGAGYDSILMRQPQGKQGGDWLVALHDEDIRIVLPDEAAGSSRPDSPLHATDADISRARTAFASARAS